MAPDNSSLSAGAEGVGQAPRKAARPPRAPKPPKAPNPMDDPSLPEGLRSSSYRLDHHDQVRYIDSGGGAVLILLPPTTIIS